MLNPKEIRKSILKMALIGNSAHIGCAFSIVEILCAVFEEMNFNPKDPERDHLILSKGHGAMALYACMRKLGYLSQKDLNRYLKDGSRLHGLVEAKLPGLEATTGSLGHGLPIAVGMALALKRLKSEQRVYCIAGDGEMNEGSMWEALLFAAHHNLNNLTLIIDQNGYQAMGKTNEILHSQSLSMKLHSFHWKTAECNGHSRKELSENLKNKPHFNPFFCPMVIVAHTRKGFGVSFMEDNNDWHYRRLTKEDYRAALKELA